MKLNPERVVLDDGKFELLLIPNPKSVTQLQNLVKALLNKEYDSEGLVFRHVSSIHFETEEELPWSLDGERQEGSDKILVENLHHAIGLMKRE